MSQKRANLTIRGLIATTPSTYACSVTPRNWARTLREVIHHLYTIPLQQSLDSLMHNIPSSSHILNPSLIDNLFHSLTSIPWYPSQFIFHPNPSFTWLELYSEMC